jgi:hypothetical protein
LPEVNDSENHNKRSPNKKCPVCGRKAVAPEMSFGKLVFPPKKKCFNCTSLEAKVFKQINANKRILIKSQKQAEAVFPLTVLDLTNDKLIGKHDDFKSLRENLNKYRTDNPKSEIKIIDKKYHDFTPFFQIPP